MSAFKINCFSSWTNDIISSHSLGINCISDGCNGNAASRAVFCLVGQVETNGNFDPQSNMKDSGALSENTQVESLVRL